MKFTFLVIAGLALIFFTACSATVRVGGAPHHHWFWHGHHHHGDLDYVLPLNDGTEGTVMAPNLQYPVAKPVNNAIAIIN